MKTQDLKDGTPGWWFEGQWWVKGEEITELRQAKIGGRVTLMLCQGQYANPTRWNVSARPDLREDARHWLMIPVRNAKGKS